MYYKNKGNSSEHLRFAADVQGYTLIYSQDFILFPIRTVDSQNSECLYRTVGDTLVCEYVSDNFSEYPKEEDIEKTAQVIHSYYNRNRLTEFSDKPLEYPTWEDLPQDLKHSNIMQAKDIPRKLTLIDCHIEKDDGSGLKSFTSEEEILLGKIEHERWVGERISEGWKYGSEKNVEKRISPYIAEWDKIPESIRLYDIEAVRNIIPLLKLSGLMVVRNDRK